MPNKYITETRGHVWKTDEGGEVDIFAYEGDGQYCNGPRCVNCGEGFCHHCENYETPFDCSAVGKSESQCCDINASYPGKHRAGCHGGSK